MEMRKLINIITESVGDSNKTMDELAKKYVGPNYNASNTHYKNILYRIEPPSEMFKVALKMDGGDAQSVTDELLQDNVGTTWPDFSPETYEILGYTDPHDEVSDQAQQLCSALTKSANFEFEEHSDVSASGYLWVIDCGPKAGMILSSTHYDTVYGWYVGNPAQPAVVNRWLNNFVANYKKSHPTNTPK